MVLRMAQMTDETELSCDEVLALLDQYAERSVRGEDVARLMPLVQRHLERCGDCMEEYQALLRILRAAPAV
jgi:transcriptional regulator GlxA family with amidase domain